MAAFTRDLNIVARCTQTYRTQRLKPIGLCGGQAAVVSRIVYTLVALAGIWCISLLFRPREEEVRQQ